MNNRYRKGYQFEHRVKRYLEKKGYKVFRAAGSKPIDLIAISKKTIFLIECKTHSEKIKRASEKIREIAKDTCAIPIIAYKKKDRNKIFFLDAKENQELIDIPDAENLGKYLGGIKK